MEQEFIEKTCEEANERFVQEALSGYPKYTYLPQWLNNLSLYLRSDRLEKNRNYKVFKRGTIVYVDFGINVGHELSGNHFAIILNNYDNAKNGLITVIPISSKQKKNYVPVGIILGIQSIKHVISYSDKQQEKLRILLLAALATNVLDSKTMSESLMTIAHKGTQMTPEDAIKKAKKYDLLCDTPSVLKKKANRLLQEIKQSKNVFETYKKYTKESYVMPLNIQSVSKKRIRRLNKFDPVGNIRAPAEVLNKIDRAIIECFTKNQKNIDTI